MEERKKEIVKQAAVEMAGNVLTWKTVNLIVGLLVCVYMGSKWGLQMRSLHENDMYFSAIKVQSRHSRGI